MQITGVSPSILDTYFHSQILKKNDIPSLMTLLEDSSIVLTGTIIRGHHICQESSSEH